MFTSFCKKIDFPIEAIEYLAPIDFNLCQNAKSLEKIELSSNYIRHNEYKKAEETLKELEAQVNIKINTLWVIVLVDAAIKSYDLYKQNGISDEVYIDTMKDITYKLNEGKKVENNWGIFVAYWYPMFFTCDRFKLGRLQYERRLSPIDYKGIVKKDDLIFACHIPSCGPLYKQDVIDSLKKAYDFYNIKKGNYLVVTCHSWLLYKPLVDLFKEGSNTKDFYDMFDVFDHHESDLKIDGWRIFYTMDLSNLNNLPEDTSLQKNIKNYLLSGGHMGSGLGMLVFDGEKIIK